MDSSLLKQYLLNSIVSFVALFSFLLFVPHAILSSLNDTPLIIYRSLMILAGMLLFLYAVFINIYGISAEVDEEMRALCFFLDWIYLLFVIPLVVPFVNSMVSAAHTASKVLIFEFKKASSRKLSVKGPPQQNLESAQKYYKIFIVIITSITWIACVVCQILSWLKDEAFYELILFRYILSAYIDYTALFVALSFIALYRELNQVQKQFQRYQRKAKQQQASNPTRSSLSDLKKKEHNDHSISVATSHALPPKSVGLNNEVIRNIDQHKKRFIKIIVFVFLLALMSTYSSIATHFGKKHILAIEYRSHPLFFNEWKYIVHISSRLVFTTIMYLWLAIPNIYQKNVPRDSLGYFTYAHCCCRCECFCCYWCCCGRIRLFCDKDKMGDQDKKIMEHMELADIQHKIKKATLTDSFDDHNRLKAPAQTQLTTGDTEEYADIDLISINDKAPSVGKQLSVKVTKCGDDTKLNTVASLKKKRSKYLDFSRVLSRNTSSMMTRTLGSADMMRSVDTGNFSAIPTYQSEVHRDKGLMEDGFTGSPVFPTGTLRYPDSGSLKGKHSLDAVDATDAMELKAQPKSVSKSVSVLESDSDDMQGIDDMIIGIKCIVYLFDVLMENINTIYDYNRKHFQARVRRLTQHFKQMDEFELVVLSNQTWSKKMKDILDYLQLRRFFGSKQHGLNIIGYDHELVVQDKKNIQLMLLHLIKKLGIENDELLFVGNRKVIQLIETINLCQTYDVDTVYLSQNKKQSEANQSNGTLQVRDLVFLESQILSSI